MKKKIKILYLYSELMGYNIPVLHYLEKNYEVELNVVSWKKKISKYQIEKSNKINYYFKEDFENDELFRFVLNVAPNVIVTSGWMDKDYLKICKYNKKKGVKIVGAMDTQWENTFRQKLATLISPFYHKKYFDFLWVSGNYQFEYAKRLGFNNNQIIFNCYSANTEFFEMNTFNYQENKTLVFIGRFDEVKGVRHLIAAFNEYIQESQSSLKIKLIGGGVNYEAYKSKQTESIIIKEFIQPNELLNELNLVQGFVLPSIYEPWGVVIHEMAAAGLPLLVSDVCGANSAFALNNFNAFVFKSNSVKDLKNVLRKFDNLSKEEILLMSERSRILAKKISPEISAASLMSLLEDN